jgi:tight adherence protein C
VTLVGAVAAAACVALIILAVRPRSRVAARLNMLHPSGARLLSGLRATPFVATSTLRASGLGIAAEHVVAAKIAAALLFALLAALLSLLVPIGAAVVIASAYGGFVLPSVVVERRAASRRREAELAIAAFVEWTHALVLSGRPVDSAVLALSRRGTGARLVDDVLTRAADLYTLGAPLYVSLIRESSDAALVSLTRLAERLERARELGHGSVGVLGDLRDELRSAGRERLIASASQVEGKMTLILTLCYLPALALLVVIPLFVTLLDGLFG